MNIEKFCLEVGWSIAELSRESKVDRKTIERAMEGTAIRKVKAAIIARAISQGLDRTVTVEELGIKTI
jgi:lambda repressor-like predicted transcriptional regulator